MRGADVAEPGEGQPAADPATLAGTLHDEGAGYALALLDRIARGTTGPAGLVLLIEFLQAGPMLAGACAVLTPALAFALAHGWAA